MDSKTIFETSGGKVCESVALKNYKNDIATGKIWTVDDDRLAISFYRFYPYTSIVGFAAYVPECDKTKLILINRSCVQRIFID